MAGADVLPKYSLLYSEFMVLNELNNVRICGDKLSVEIKQIIIKDLFQRTRRVTVRKLCDKLKAEGVISRNSKERKLVFI
jgi:CRISPR-associated endonuclease Csn1